MGTTFLTKTKPRQRVSAGGAKEEEKTRDFLPGLLSLDREPFSCLLTCSTPDGYPEPRSSPCSGRPCARCGSVSRSCRRRCCEPCSAGSALPPGGSAACPPWSCLR